MSHAFYLWLAYGAGFVLLAAEVWSLARRARRLPAAEARDEA